MQGTFDFAALETRLVKIKEQLVNMSEFHSPILNFCSVQGHLLCACSVGTPLTFWFFSRQLEEMSDWRRQGDTLSAKEALSANGETYACQQVNSAFQVVPAPLSKALISYRCEKM